MTPETQQFIISLATVLTPVLLAIIGLIQVVIMRVQGQIHKAVNSTATALAAKNAADLAASEGKSAVLVETLAGMQNPKPHVGVSLEGEPIEVEHVEIDKPTTNTRG